MRRSRDEEPVYDDPPRKRLTGNQILIFGLGGTLFVGAVSFVGIIILLQAWQNARMPAPIPREEFRAKVIDKTPEEVVRALGKPGETSDSADSMSWYYYGRSRDPLTGKVDFSAQVNFDKRTGRCRSVNF